MKQSERTFQMEEARRLHSEGVSGPEIARRLGLSSSTIYRYLKAPAKVETPVKAPASAEPPVPLDPSMIIDTKKLESVLDGMYSARMRIKSYLATVIPVLETKKEVVR